MTDNTKDSLLGRRAYEAYCDAVGGVAFNGDQLPTWDEQQDRNPTIAHGWRCAGRAAADNAPAQEQIAGYRNLGPALVRSIAQPASPFQNSVPEQPTRS
jgi:hypothetical protein